MDIFDIAEELGAQLSNPILIGGMAALYHFSSSTTHDIDTIIAISDRSTVSELLDDFSVNSSHGSAKGRGTYRGVHVDVYFPYQSKLGVRAKIDVHLLSRHRGERVGSWTLLSWPGQFVSKMAALLDRQGTSRGQGDADVLAQMITEGLDARLTLSVFLECSDSGNPMELWHETKNVLVNVAPPSQRGSVIKFFNCTE